MKQLQLRKNSHRESKNNSSIIQLLKRIKVKLDARTTVMINRPSSLKVWQRVYPGVKVIFH
jgi:hypothetical protein